MKKYQIVSIGGVLQDVMITSHDLKVINQGSEKLLACAYGAKLNVHQVAMTSGGGAANTAYNFANLGLRASIIARVGNDEFWQKSKQDLQSQKVDLSLVQFSQQLATGFSFILNQPDVNEHTVFTFRGANEKLQLTRQLLTSFKTDWIYLSSLSGKLAKTNLNAIFSAGYKIAWNPGSEQLKLSRSTLSRYLKKTEVLLVNQLEAKNLAKDFNLKYGQVEELANMILNLGPKIVVVTCGGEGVHIASNQKSIFKPALKVRVFNSTGAGDAFGSSFIAGLILFQGDIDKSAKLAICQSAYVTTQIGAQKGLLSREQLQVKKLI